MTLKEVMTQLEEFGNEGTKNTLIKHGAKEPFFGVKVADLKKIQKKVKKDHSLALELYKTGNSDAMYLAGLIADEKAVTKEELKTWAKVSYWSYLSEYTVPWLAADSEHGWALGLEWIESEEENIASCGWSSISNWISTRQDKDLDIETLRKLLKQVETSINENQNRVKYTMNGFVIAIGSYVEALTNDALAVAKKIGKVSVEMNGTACKVPLANDYIMKVVDKDRIGKKRKQARC